MKWFVEILNGALRRRMVFAAGLIVGCLVAAGARAQCPGCVTFNGGVEWGNVSFNSLDEASGLAVSTRNPGVVWSHNDDGNLNDPNKDIRLFAFRTNGPGLARYNLNVPNLRDLEDMALGPGPVAGTTYLYVGDIGSGDFSGVNEIRVLRVPEPVVPPLGPGGPPVLDFAGVQVFTLRYTNGFVWDAEGMFVDPLTADLYIFTKFNSLSYVYRVNLNAAAAGSTNTMELVLSIPFHEVSGAAISHDGSQIALRNEFAAQIWQRCPGETVAQALGRTGIGIQLVNLNAEPNGEAIAFLPHGRGYLTTTDSPPVGNKEEQPPIHFFGPTCAPTVITQQPQSVTNNVGENVMFTATATGENLQYQWRFNGADLSGEDADILWLNSIQPANAGAYTLRVLGDGGAATSSPALLGVRVLPPVISSQPALLTYAPTGGTVRLAVGVQGTAPFQFNWAFGKKPLHQNSPVLTLNNVTNKSSGKYRVTVTNSAGQAISRDASLKVLIPATIIGQPVSRTNQPNSTVSFRVRVKGSPPLRYQWYFNGVAISNATRSAFSLRRAQTTNSGLYSVRVTNLVGTNFSAPAQLTVP